jgi:hypothetical protein
MASTKTQTTDTVDDAFAKEAAALQGERAELDERIQAALAARNEARTELATAIAAMPELRQQFLFANPGEKRDMRLAVLAGDEKIAALEEARDDAQLALLSAMAERAKHMLAICAQRREALAEQWKPLAAAMEAISAEEVTHSQVLRSSAGEIGSLKRLIDERAVERGAERAKELQRADADFERSQQRSAFPASA